MTSNGQVSSGPAARAHAVARWATILIAGLFAVGGLLAFLLTRDPMLLLSAVLLGGATLLVGMMIQAVLSRGLRGG